MTEQPSGGWTGNIVSGTAGISFQARTMVFGGTGDVPVAEAVRDLGPLFADVLGDGFTGRRWLIDQIDGFLAERPCGYLWVEGEAGVGKTALAAHLVRERGWAGHFSRLTRGGSAHVALRNLAGQLARGHGLAPGGLLPERWCTPEGFGTLLAKITPPLVLVVDGADEAEQVAGAQPWGLPMELPPGVFVVGTYRTGSPPPRSTAPATVLRLVTRDPRNIADVAAHVARVQPDAAGKLLPRCGGVWVYLRYVLNEIRQGVRTVDDPLPADLSRYYIDSVELWSRSTDWPDALLPLVSTLAVAGEPLGAPALAALSAVDEAVVRGHCHRTLRPFLGAVDGQAGRGFALYHASLREFLGGVRPGDDSPDQDWKWWDILSSAAVAAHHRVAGHYLTRFGGLADGLPALVSSPAAATVDGGYPLRHLARHLVAAGRDEDLHRLLHADDPDRPGPPAWFAAHDHAGTVDDFLSDVAVARDRHARSTDQALATGGPAPTLCDEVYYDLVAASVVSRTNAISAELVAALVAGGVWTRARAVAHALRLPTATARAHVLAVLATELAERDVLDLALAEAEQVTSPYPRAEVLLKLVPLDQELVPKALHAMADIAGDHQQAGAIVALAPWLTGGELGTARTLAEGLASAHARARALTALGDRTGALLAVRAISGEQERAAALAVLAPHLSGDELADALALAESITGHHRVTAIAAVTARMPDRELADLLHTPIPDPRARAGVLTTLARHLPAAVILALAAVRAIGEPAARAEALTNLVPLLTEQQLTEALRSVPFPLAHARCLTALAGRLPHRGLAQRAREAAVAIADPHDRAEALTRLAPLLPAAPRREALTDALAAATVVPPDDGGRDLPARLGWPGLTETHRWPETLTTMSNRLRQSRSPGGRHRLPLANLAAFMERATADKDDRSRSVALRVLVPHLATSGQLGEALAATPYGDRELLCALVLRADSVADDAAFVGLLRLALRSGGRATCTAILAAALPRLVTLAGEDTADRLSTALRDVHRWWP